MASVAPPVPSPESEQKPLSFPARVVGALFSPGKTFADIARKPSFIAPLLLIAVLSGAHGLSLVKRGVADEVAREQMAKSGRLEQLPPEQRERAEQFGITSTRVGFYATPVLAAIAMFLVAGVLLLITNFVLGAEVRYGTMVAVTCYGAMPSMISSILSTVVVWLKPPSDVNVQNLIPASNLAILVDQEAHKALYRLASSIDLFSVWHIVVLGIGIAAAARFSVKKGVMTVLIPWAIWVLGSVAMVAIFAK